MPKFNIKKYNENKEELLRHLNDLKTLKEKKEAENKQNIEKAAKKNQAFAAAMWEEMKNMEDVPASAKKSHFYRLLRHIVLVGVGKTLSESIGIDFYKNAVDEVFAGAISSISYDKGGTDFMGRVSGEISIQQINYKDGTGCQITGGDIEDIRSIVNSKAEKYGAEIEEFKDEKTGNTCFKVSLPKDSELTMGDFMQKVHEALGQMKKYGDKVKFGKEIDKTNESSGADKAKEQKQRPQQKEPSAAAEQTLGK